VIRFLEAGALTVVMVVVAACSGTAPEIPIYSPSPSPVTPAYAVIEITGAFVPFKNQYGDQLEALNLRITSNVPVPFKVQVLPLTHYVNKAGQADVVLMHDGTEDQKCTNDDGCLVNANAAGLDDFYCDGSCPAGTYVFDALACSYNSEQFGDICTNQTGEYLSWVGNLGQNLKGNPKAKPDLHHPAILNLTAEVTVTHP